MEPYHIQQTRYLHSILCEKLRKVIKHPGQYLDKRDMDNIGIRCWDFDLYSQKTQDNAPRFTEPFSMTKLDQILSKTQPWNEYKLSNDVDPYGASSAQELSFLFSEYLDWGKPKYAHPPKQLIQYT